MVDNLTLIRFSIVVSLSLCQKNVKIFLLCQSCVAKHILKFTVWLVWYSVVSVQSCQVTHVMTQSVIWSHIVLICR